MREKYCKNDKLENYIYSVFFLLKQTRKKLQTIYIYIYIARFFMKNVVFAIFEQNEFMRLN